MTIFFHEQLYRSNAVMAKLKNYPVTICGAGALGANIAENLARSGFEKLTVIDRDRIEERNLSTQPYYRSDVGAFKAKILANNLYRAIGTKVDAKTKELTPANVNQLLQDSQLIIDVFDNSVARQILKDYADKFSIPCLHAGLAADYAEVIWNEFYCVPSEVNDDVCDYPLARNLVILTVAVVCETIISFIATAEQRNFTITLKDLSVQSLFL
ncbi:MAG: ThiF family adenylyltransferase [Nostoc sp. ZfuVER08]|uniref:ThiF family adenylyltransferase n=1 Tax=Nostoc punctiforme FACHB-252 TaxID=1357509 RepID=A0ABR8HG03_NOSPU|nr:ThiF family adenylyltransferase [Nostoc punctiforme]MBD2614732.1 ThiF family adenylyltransferase [Nostoc punctiforme FACHB-252]MDZ8011159.1 ThiF family adenylyltransferase [Nostoc sp. ZfuVER08]